MLGVLKVRKKGEKNMNISLKKVLIVSAKNAVNAILTNSVLMTTLGNWQQLHTAAGWVVVGKVTLSCILAREAMVWVPKVLAWSQSETNGKADAAHGG